jgi:hypothetical protein
MKEGSLIITLQPATHAKSFKFLSKKFFWLFSLFIFLLSCWQPLSAQRKSSDLKRVIIIRHAEKPDQGDNLSCAGLNRALQLPGVLIKKFGVPNSVFVPQINTGKSTSTARMYQTIVPFAVKYNLDVNTKYDVDDTKDLAKAILNKQGTVLVVWEHNKIDNLLKDLGVESKEKWSDDDYDSI